MLVRIVVAFAVGFGSLALASGSERERGSATPTRAVATAEKGPGKRLVVKPGNSLAAFLKLVARDLSGMAETLGKLAQKALEAKPAREPVRATATSRLSEQVRGAEAAPEQGGKHPWGSKVIEKLSEQVRGAKPVHGKPVVTEKQLIQDLSTKISKLRDDIAKVRSYLGFLR